MSYPDNNPKTAFGVKKCPLDLVPPIAVAALAEALANGAEKYGPYNWREHQISSSVYYAAALRHLMAWWDGEDIAQDSGVHHLAHAMACMALVLDAQGIDMLNDNRPTPGGMPERLAPSPKSEVPRDGNALTEDELAELEASFVDGGSASRYELEAMRRLAAYEDVSDLDPLSYQLAQKIDDEITSQQGYWYVATPYTSHPGGQIIAYRSANEAAARLHTEHGLAVFSPIGHSHSLCTIYGTHMGINDHLDAEFWMKFDKPMLDAAYGVAVVMMDGWFNSKGIAHEVAEAKRQGKPVHYYDWPGLRLSFSPP